MRESLLQGDGAEGRDPCLNSAEHLVDELYLYGYTADEIEELLYEPEELANAINMIDYEELYC